MLTARARAKINLFLHAGTRRADGYHSLASWAAFTEIGDEVSVEKADNLLMVLKTAGPFGSDLPHDPGSNLVYRALTTLLNDTGTLQGIELRLTKNLPVASGLGGGSADAAATLHLLNEMLGLNLEAARLFEIAATLGSDVPVCVYNRSALMSGRGEHLAPGPDLPPLPVVLLNPGVPVSTAAVFARLTQHTGAVLPRLPDAISSAEQLAAILAPTKNDLEAPAIALAPEIATALEALRTQPGILMARMSGSGATCFALAADENAASTAALTLKRARPDWWLAATRLDC